MKTRKLLIAVLFISACSMNAQVVINVDATQKGPKISPTHYGIFYEDINHAADGGLYAELIRNRSFEDDLMGGGRNMRRRGGQNNQNEGQTEPRISNWFSVGSASLKLIQENLLNSVQHNALNVMLKKAGDGVRNEGFWGMNAVKGTKYRLSFWAKSLNGYNGTITAQLQSTNGQSLGNVKINANFGKEWKKYTAIITATGNDPRAEFSLTADKVGEFQIDVVSLFPPTFKNRENGMRPDLAQMLADMHPRFMRFPGGCFVEGQQSPDNAFRWKRTIGPIEQREGHANVNWGYRTSDGIGFHEFLQLSEDLGAKPLFVVNVGIWHGGCTPYDQIGEWIEECMDALEYANGDITTKYGKMRAENGHPAPFNLEYIEIGNENYNFNMNNNSDQSDHYPERYIQFYNAIKAKYPNVHCIGNVESWSTDNPSWRNNYPVEMVDEHYYRNPKWFADRFDKYDSYDRSKYKIYVGEYAVTSQFGDIGNLNAALGEAVYMMGMENNSDVVVMNSYAPIFVNENDARWRPDMIRFNSNKVMGTPSYYVQQLFPNNIGTQVLKTDWTYKLTMPQANKEVENKPVQVGLATWNTNVQYRNAQLIVDGSTINIGDFSKWVRQSGSWNATNSELSQTSNETPAMILCPTQIDAKKYTYKVQAKKLSGAEGFMVLFGYKDAQNFQWYNIGGWSNVQNNVEQTIGGGKIQIARDKRFSVQNDKWYDLQVDIEGDNIKCYLDGKLDFTCKLQKSSAMEGVYASTTIDAATKTMYVKIVNVGEGFADGTLNLKNCSIDTNKADAVTLIRLASKDGNDENTLDNPKNIYPQTTTVKASNRNKVDFKVPAFSVNILKIKLT
ncbi:MAG: carbohydrate binding domain-containing protein [Bacteroidaceae bacterium]|nr:carbohydrate binding domain-containing protein [Bacteroidaceae bacterium]